MPYDTSDKYPGNEQAPGVSAASRPKASIEEGGTKMSKNISGSSAPQQQQRTASSALVSANLYDLAGHSLHVNYATSGFDGKPHLSYQDAHQSLSFSGDQIETVEARLGHLVSVVIRSSVDAGSTTFSLLVPRVNLT